MFRGATKVTLDSKGRLAIPTRYRERIIGLASGHLVATVDRDYCLLLYPLPEWEEIERQLIQLPAFKKKTRMLKGLMLGYATELEMDGHGRILLTRELREFARLERQVMLIGQGTKFELWDEKSWTARRDGWLAADDDDLDLPEELKLLSL